MRLGLAMSPSQQTGQSEEIPFSRRMGQRSRNIDKSSLLVDRGCLHGGDLMLAEVLRTMSSPLESGA